IETSVSATAPLSATLEDYTISANDRGIDIMIPWTNREQDKKLFQLYKGEGASRTLIAEKRVVIIQKLNDNIGYDDDLFMIDDRQISLHDNVSIQTWEKAGSLNLNAERFSAHGLKVSGFAVTDVSNGQSIENAGSAIRQETKAFISALGPGAQIHISGIKAVYTDHGLPVMLDLNYTPVLTLAPEM
ncbi:MAG: hypothetical protein JST76_15440, partial [Bacteroidetes bacterium]|nr:hypothetical protein [Bacteroidota bacterium]